VAKGTDRLERDGADGVVARRIDGAQTENAVFRYGSAGLGGLERVDSDGDEYVLGGWVDDRVLEKDGI